MDGRTKTLHCRQCGARVEHRIPEGDGRERACCLGCGTIHYDNPLNVVGTIPMRGERVLLCRRAIEPRHGLWTLPAGFMELGETLAGGAARETDEEAGAQIEMGRLFSIIDVVRVGQVHFFYEATVLSDVFDPGPESLEVQLFREDEVPWDELAFRTVKLTLQKWFEARRAGGFSEPFIGAV